MGTLSQDGVRKIPKEKEMSRTTIDLENIFDVINAHRGGEKSYPETMGIHPDRWLEIYNHTQSVIDNIIKEYKEEQIDGGFSRTEVMQRALLYIIKEQHLNEVERYMLLLHAHDRMAYALAESLMKFCNKKQDQ